MCVRADEAKVGTSTFLLEALHFTNKQQHTDTTNTATEKMAQVTSNQTSSKANS